MKTCQDQLIFPWTGIGFVFTVDNSDQTSPISTDPFTSR